MAGRTVAALGLVCILFLPVSAEPKSFKVADVKVLRDGMFRADQNGRQTAEQCALFKLHDAAATAWFKAAREVTQQVWLEALDWTQCAASGTLIIAEGHSYPWQLDQSGRGQVILTRSVSIYLTGAELPFRR